jgi:hypothetical protein
MFKTQPTRQHTTKAKPTQPLCPHHAPHPGIIFDVMDDHKSAEGMWHNHLRNEGSILENLDRVIVDEARMQQTHIRNIQNYNFIDN